jgi:TatD DNase family protein
MIDTHCHLTDDRLSSQLDAVIDRARAAGVTRLVTIGTGPQDSIDSVDLCRGREDVVRCTAGVHPNYCHEVELESVDRVIRPLASHPSVVAIGEFGLDYHYDRAPKDRQRQFFEAQLQLCIDMNRPAVIHCREAVTDALAVMSGFREVRAVFHCFTGTADEARRILDAGYLLGFTGPVTYKQNDELRAIARDCPADRIVVETDAPWLSPEPVRSQKTCEPAFVMHTARRIAELRGMLLDEFDALTTRNAERLYGWTS